MYWLVVTMVTPAYRSNSLVTMARWILSTSTTEACGGNFTVAINRLFCLIKNKLIQFINLKKYGKSGKSWKIPPMKISCMKVIKNLSINLISRKKNISEIQKKSVRN
jgi:hypothetical protein